MEEKTLLLLLTCQVAQPPKRNSQEGMGRGEGAFGMMHVAPPAEMIHWAPPAPVGQNPWSPGVAQGTASTRKGL